MEPFVAYFVVLWQNPMGIGFMQTITTKGETSNISYATVYPLGMFIRVIIAQVLVMFFV